MYTVTSLRGITAVQIRVGATTGKVTYNSASLTLNVVNDENKRSGTVAFWSNRQIHKSEMGFDQFHGQAWSLVGTGLIVHKTGMIHHADNDSYYGVIALWPIVSEAADTFLRIGEKNALASVRMEIGCQAFGIFRSINNPAVFTLVEVFDNIGDFNRHLETQHFREFADYARPQYLGDRSQTLKGIARWQ